MKFSHALAQMNLFNQLDVTAHLITDEPTSIEDLAARLGISIDKAAELLSLTCLRGQAREVYSGNYVLVVRPPESPIRALTLWQPWATLVTIGAKRIETRSWATSHRGPLAIHAAKHTPKTAYELAQSEPFRTALHQAGFSLRTLPAGVIVATCRLVDVHSIDADYDLASEPERSFGDYTPGRYAWVLEDVYPLPDPIPARGSQGLWLWIPPELETA